MVEKKNNPTKKSESKYVAKRTALTFIINRTDRISNARTTKKMKSTTTIASVFDDGCS